MTTEQKVPTFAADYAASSEAIKVFNQPQNVPQESFSCKPLFGAVYGELGWIRFLKGATVLWRKYLRFDIRSGLGFRFDSIEVRGKYCITA